MHDGSMIHVCFRCAENSSVGIEFFHLSFTVIYNRSTTVTRHLFFMRLNHLHPCAATLFQYVQLRQSRTNRQMSTPLGLATAGQALLSAAGMMGEEIWIFSQIAWHLRSF